MPPKKRNSKKSCTQEPDNTWLTQFCLDHKLPDSLMDVLAEHQIKTESLLAEFTEQDFVEMKLVVG